MKNFEKVEYISYWDAGEVESTAKVNKTTGEVYDIKTIDVGEDYEICEAEFVRHEDGTMEQVIANDEDGCYYIISKSEEKFKTVDISGTKFIVSEDLEVPDIHRICGIEYNSYAEMQMAGEL